MIAIFPELAAAAAAADVERLAVLVRRYFGGEQTFAPCPDLVAMLRQVGITVEAWRSEGHGALAAKDVRGTFGVAAFVRPEAEPAAARFLLAHLLGHYLFDVQPLIARGDWQVSGFREAVCPLKRYGQDSGDGRSGLSLEAGREERADRFAAALLMPLGMVRRALERLTDMDRVAAFFGVTSACLLRRLSDIGLRPSGPVNFLDAEQQLGGPAQRLGPAAAVAEAKLNAPREQTMPRSYAASSYGQTERTTRGERPAPLAAAAAAASAAGSAATASSHKIGGGGAAPRLPRTLVAGQLQAHQRASEGGAAAAGHGDQPQITVRMRSAAGAARSAAGAQQAGAQQAGAQQAGAQQAGAQQAGGGARTAAAAGHAPPRDAGGAPLPNEARPTLPRERATGPRPRPGAAPRGAGVESADIVAENAAAHAPDHATPTRLAGGGMERLRALAQQLDKTVKR